MEVVVKHLQLDKTTGIISYRRRFPKDLIRYIPGGSPQGRGRSELKVSLRAKSIDTPGAMAIYQEAEKTWTRLVDMAERQHSGMFHPLDEPTIAYLMARYHHQELEDVESIRWSQDAKRRGEALSDVAERQGVSLDQSTPARWTKGPRFVHEVIVETAQALRTQGDLEGLIEAWSDRAVQLAEESGYVVDKGSEGFKQLCIALNNKAMQAHSDAIRALAGEIVQPPALPVAPEPFNPEQTPSPPATEMTLQDVAEALMASKVSPVGHSTISSWKGSLRGFRELHGTPTPSKITKAMVTEWLELLAQRPAKLPKEDRDLPLPALVAKYEGSEADRLELKTIRTHLAALSAIWNKGQEAGTINDVLQNPFKARKSLSGSHEDEQGTEYTLEELEAILSLPVFTSGDRPAPLLGDACYWIPLLLQWTGARPEEVAQLMLSDIFQDEASGQWVLRITDDGVHPVKGKRQLKSAPRDPLIPQALIELGLPAYVEHLRHQGETALFPTLRVKSSTKGYLSPLFGEWWSGYLKQNGIHLAPQRGKTRRPLRDFRTAWATQARADRIPEEAMQYLMGHSATGKGTTRTYGSQHPHARWMSDITYSKLDLSRVKPWGKP